MSDADGDGIATGSDCDDDDASVGTAVARPCATDCGSGVETCTDGLWAACDCSLCDPACAMGQVCVEAVCLLEDELPCATNDACLNVCINGACAAPAGPGDLCDEEPDCGADLSCADNRCLLQNGQPCADNVECAGVCIDDACANPSPDGGPCNETADCEPDLNCSSGTCVSHIDKPEISCMSSALGDAHITAYGEIVADQLMSRIVARIDGVDSSDSGWVVGPVAQTTVRVNSRCSATATATTDLTGVTGQMRGGSNCGWTNMTCTEAFP